MGMQPALGGPRNKTENDMTRLTREQAVALSSEATVAGSEAANACFTNRLTDGTPDAGMVEFSGSDSDEHVTVRCYYLIDSAAVEAAGDDLSSLVWTPGGYEVV